MSNLLNAATAAASVAAGIVTGLVVEFSTMFQSSFSYNMSTILAFQGQKLPAPSNLSSILNPGAILTSPTHNKCKSALLGVLLVLKSEYEKFNFLLIPPFPNQPQA